MSTFPDAATLKGLQAGDYDGTDDWLVGSPWTGFGGWSAVTLDCWVDADADAVGGAGDNRGIYGQGPGDVTSGLYSIVMHIRESSSDGTIVAPILFSVFGSTSGQGAGYILSEANAATAAPMHLCGRWRDGQVPRLWKDAVALAAGIDTNGNPLSAIGSGTVTVQAGNIQLGIGPGTATFPRAPWKGLIAMVRLRATDISDGQLRTEYANQSDPKSFYGLGGWDAPTESNRAPVAVPEAPFPMVQNTATLVDVITNDLEPDGQNKSLTAADTPSTGLASVAVSGGQVLVTPAAAFVGDASFLYTLADVPPAGVTAKTSRGKARVTISGPPIELPAPRRTIWGNNLFTRGITDAQLTAVLGGDLTGVFVRVEVAGAAGATLQPGDHVNLRAGNFTAAPTTDVTGLAARVITVNGTAANPIVFRAEPGAVGPGVALTVLVQTAWQLNGTNKIVYGLRFESGPGRLLFGRYIQDKTTTPTHPASFVSCSNCGAVRCEFTGWNRAYAVLPAGNGGPTLAGCYLFYCSFHDPMPWGAVGSGDTTPFNDSSNALRMAIRSQEGNDPGFTITGTFPYNFHIKRCYFHDFPDKPIHPGSYNSGQDDALEWGQTGPTIAAERLRVTRTGGIVTGVTDYLNSGLIFEDSVVSNHAEAGGACVDLKVGGCLVQRIAFRNCAGRMDNRWGPNNIWTDISFLTGSPGAWNHGWGHSITRTVGGTLTFTNGENNDAGGHVDGHQSAEHCTVRDRNGAFQIIQGANNYTFAPARNIFVFGCNPSAASDVTDIPGPPVAIRLGCTFDGVTTVAAPLSVPANTDVGHMAPWTT